MPAFDFSEFINSAVIVWTDHPIYALLFAGACCVLAFRFAFVSGVRVTQRHEMDDREPEPLRRVVLDASARFPPKAQDRRVN